MILNESVDMGAERQLGAYQAVTPELRVQQIEQRLQASRDRLLSHPIYEVIDSVGNLHRFMQSHVFAVWDFMSLLKSLQRQLCGTDVPWLPPQDPVAARLVNEIVLGEETDVDGSGNYRSHFEMYHRAMQRCGAETTRIDAFTDAIRRGLSVEQSLSVCHAPEYVRRFVSHTFEVIAGGDLCAIAAALTFSREDLLPDVFQRIVDSLNSEMRGELDDLRYYLDRHIELDSDEHVVLARQMLTTLCGDDAQKWQIAEDVAEAGLQHRIVLWDGMYTAMADELDVVH